MPRHDPNIKILRIAIIVLFLLLWGLSLFSSDRTECYEEKVLNEVPIR